MSKKNPILDLPAWTREALAVAQDWELEQGNECALIWADLGPELARRVCENPEVIGGLTGVVVEPRARAWALARVWAMVRAGAWAWAGTRAKAGVLNVARARTGK